LRGGDNVPALTMAENEVSSPIQQKGLLINDADKHTSAHLSHSPIV
jgi:hypothetical protein